jgi:hypothetical protein
MINEPANFVEFILELFNNANLRCVVGYRTSLLGAPALGAAPSPLRVFEQSHYTGGVLSPPSRPLFFKNARSNCRIR